MSAFKKSVVGAWELVSYVNYPVEENDSEPIYPLGKNATGMILYTPDGYMSAQLQQPGQKHFATPFPWDGTDAELAESATRYVGYSGRYDVDESGPQTVLLHGFYVSSFPNWIGNTQRRVAKLEGEVLTLSLEGPVELKASLLLDYWLDLD